MNKKSPITTHVLDVSGGKPASNLACKLEKLNTQGQWEKIGEGMTNQDGRVESLMSGPLTQGIYRIEFSTKRYFEEKQIPTFYPGVVVQFEVWEPSQHYHVPLLLSPFGYSTYRGS